MVAMVPSPQHRRIQQLANMLGYKSVVKTRKYDCFYHVLISFFKARHIVNAPCLSVCELRGAESIILSAGSAETIILSGGSAESMIISACVDSMVASAQPAASMILSVLFDHVITLLS
jgi:hypothetical protein